MTLSENKSAWPTCPYPTAIRSLLLGTTPANIPVTTVAAHLRQTGIMQPALQLYTLDLPQVSLTQAGGKRGRL